MFENILGMLRKRRRLDEEADATGGGAAGSDSHSTTSGGTAAASMFASGLPTHSNMNMFWDSLFGANDEASNTAANNTTMRTQQPQQQHQQTYHSDSNNTSLANNGNNMSMCIDRVKQILENKISRNQQVEQEDMEIDPSPVPPPQEYSDNPAVPYHSESSMNFDYLHSLHADSAMDSSNSGSSSRIQDSNTPPRHFAAVGANNASSSPNYGQVDESRVVDRPFNLNERFVTVLDQLDARVEKFRKDALGLQEKRDFLLMSMDLIKSNDLMQNLTESEREEISCYIQRVNSRLSTVELNVRTVRDQSQEDSLCQINSLIDMMITMGDPVLSRQRCQMYLNACCSARESGNLASCSESGIDMDAGPIDKKFESVLLGCTLDDQKNIKKRLQALMGYLNKQIIHH